MAPFFKARLLAILYVGHGELLLHRQSDVHGSGFYTSAKVAIFSELLWHFINIFIPLNYCTWQNPMEKRTEIKIFDRIPVPSKLLGHSKCSLTKLFIKLETDIKKIVQL
jgi:hypothetical protein